MGKVSPPSISPETQGGLFEFCGVSHMLGQEQQGWIRKDSRLLGAWLEGDSPKARARCRHSSSQACCYVVVVYSRR